MQKLTYALVGWTALAIQASNLEHKASYVHQYQAIGQALAHYYEQQRDIVAYFNQDGKGIFRQYIEDKGLKFVDKRDKLDLKEEENRMLFETFFPFTLMIETFPKPFQCSRQCACSAYHYALSIFAYCYKYEKAPNKYALKRLIKENEARFWACDNRFRPSTPYHCDPFVNAWKYVYLPNKFRDLLTNRIQQMFVCQKTFFFYLRYSINMQLNEDKGRLVHTQEKPLLLFNTDLYDPSQVQCKPHNKLYMVCVPNRYRQRNKYAWFLKALSTAEEIVKKYHLFPRELPASSREEPSFQLQLVQKMEKKELKEAIQGADLCQLKQVPSPSIIARYFYEGETKSKIADELSITPERFLKLLFDALEDDDLPIVPIFVNKGIKAPEGKKHWVEMIKLVKIDDPKIHNDTLYIGISFQRGEHGKCNPESIQLHPNRIYNNYIATGAKGKVSFPFDPSIENKRLYQIVFRTSMPRTPTSKSYQPLSITSSVNIAQHVKIYRKFINKYLNRFYHP